MIELFWITTSKLSARRTRICTWRIFKIWKRKVTHKTKYFQRYIHCVLIFNSSTWQFSEKQLTLLNKGLANEVTTKSDVEQVIVKIVTYNTQVIEMKKENSLKVLITPRTIVRRRKIPDSLNVQIAEATISHAYP